MITTTGQTEEKSVLDAVDLATLKEDKVCIQRDHATGGLAWRFATPQADPLGMMMRALVLQVLHDEGLFGRMAQLEQRVAELEALLGKGA